jgi:ribosomal-protein-serine acetyltransferase
VHREIKFWVNKDTPASSPLPKKTFDYLFRNMKTDTMAKERIVTEGVQLELLAEHHAPLLLELVNKNRVTLRQWLPWVGHMQTVDNFTNYIRRCHEQLQAGTDISYVIKVEDRIAGRIGLHHIDRQNKTGAIGYWIGEEFSGRGIVTKACQEMIKLAFEETGLHRIEIKCATGNYKSAAVAERLGFTKEAVLRQAEWVNGQPLDLHLYSLLRSEK